MFLTGVNIDVIFQIMFFRMGSFAEELRWLHFFALACSAISEVCVLARKYFIIIYRSCKPINRSYLSHMYISVTLKNTIY